MRALTVLDDCRRALVLAENTMTEKDFRIRWASVVSLLRAVGHALKHVDRESSPSVRDAVDAAWTRWESDRERHKIFWSFIKAERDSILKNYEFGTQSGPVAVILDGRDQQGEFFLDECLFKPMLNEPFMGEDGRDVARDAIEWWELQLSQIQADANSAQRC